MRIHLLLAWVVFTQALPPGALGQERSGATTDPEKSAYFAFVDRDYVFTVEVVSPGVPILNFVSMTDTTRSLPAKQIRLRLQSRTVVASYFLVDTGNPQEPISAPAVTMRPRSSFGVRIQGSLEGARELYGVTLRVGDEELKLAPLTSMAFENLVLKINRINLASPDFRDDWNALKLEFLGSRASAPRRQEFPGGIDFKGGPQTSDHRPQTKSGCVEEGEPERSLSGIPE